MPAKPLSSLLLYGNAVWTSPYVLSCFVGLTEKQLPFEVKTVALHEGAQRPPVQAYANAPRPPHRRSLV